MSAKTRDPYEAAATPLREEEARLMARLAEVRGLLGALASARAAAGIAGYMASLPDRPIQSTVAATPVNPPDKFKGMGLGEAAAKQLSESDHIELTAKQIWAALSAAGFSILSEHPEQATSWALRKRERKEKDVVLIGDGKWGWAKWYSKDRVREIRAKRTNASGRNHAEHVERTKAGIANAKQTRLSHWGRKRTVNGDQMAAAYYAFQRGAKSKLQLAKAANMAWPTFNLYWAQYELENWKPGDLFPPKRRETSKKATEIRLENMWPREPGHVNGHANGKEPQAVPATPPSLFPVGGAH